jgi:hypothetical protein
VNTNVGWVEPFTRTVGRPCGSEKIVRHEGRRDKCADDCAPRTHSPNSPAHAITRPVNRRSLIVLLVGVISALVGGLVASFMERARCLDAGGAWNAAARQCRLPSGAVAGFSATSILVGLLVAIFVTAFLYRAILFFARRGLPRSS